MIPALLLVACLLCALVCLAVLALCLKLYTEILKEKAIRGRPPTAVAEAVAERARAGWGTPPTPLRGGGTEAGP